MTAALYAVRSGKSAVIVEKAGFGGQITYSPKVENYPGTLQMSGNQFADQMMDQLMAHGVDMELGNVIAIQNNGASKLVKTEEGDVFEGKAVVLATGVKHRMLGIPGEEDQVGNGISFCAVCDGDFYKNQTVVLVGGGNSALQEAILLSEKCSKVIMLQDLDFFTGDKILQDTLFAKPNVEKHTGIKVTGLVLEDNILKGVKALKKADNSEFTVDCTGLFVAIGLIPQNEAFIDLAELDSSGYFASTEECTTKTSGVFAAGDCRAKSVRQLTTAVADGAVAALAACRYVDSL